MTEVKIPNPFQGLSVDDVDALYQRGEADDDSVLDYAASEDFRNNGLYGMDVENVAHAHARGYLNDDQVLDYSDANVSPIGFYSKDIGLRAPAHGINMALQSAGKHLFDGVLNVPGAIANLGIAGVEALGRAAGLVDADEHIKRFGWLRVFEPDQVMPDPKTTAGKFSSEMTEFMVPFLPASKAVKMTNFVTNLVTKSPKIQAFMTRFPKIGKFLPDAIQGSIAGTLPDVLNDPFEGALSDAAKDLGILPEYLEFMTTNPDNPEAIERLKRLVEGVMVGAFADTFIAAAKHVSVKAWAKLMNDPQKVAETFRAKYPDVEPSNMGPGTTPFNEPPKSRQVPFEAEAQRLEAEAAARGADGGARYPTQAVEEALERTPVEDQVYKAYQDLKSSGGSENVSIAELARAAGMSPGEMQVYLTKGSSDGRAVLTMGEPIYASADELDHAVSINGQKNLKVRIDEPEVAEITEYVTVHGILPDNLSKASPRYGKAELDFTSDVDRAIYIVANTSTKSKAHEAYLGFLKKLGLNEKDITKYGADIKSYIADHADGDFVSIPDMEVKLVRKVKRTVEPVVTRKKPKAEPPVKTALTRDQIRTMDPHLLTPGEYATRLDAQRLPSTEEILNDASALNFDGVPAAKVKQIADILRIPPGTKEETASRIRARIMLRDYLTKPERLLADFKADARRDLYKEVTGQKMPTGKASTPERQAADMVLAIDKMLSDAAPLFAAAKHGGAVYKAVRQGRDIPAHVLSHYREAEWAQKYAKSKGISLSKVTEQEPQVKLERGEEVAAESPEVVTRVEAETFGGPRDSEGAMREDFAGRPEAQAGADAVELPKKKGAALKHTTKTDNEAIRILKKAKDVKDLDDVLEADGAFLEKIEEGSSGGTVELIKRLYAESKELMDKFRKPGSGTFANINAQSGQIFKKLAELTGRNTNAMSHLVGVDTVLGMARQTYAELQHKAAQAHFLNQFFTTYSEQVVKLIDEALDVRTGTFEKELRAFTHVKQMQELQALIFGVRAEGGRLLNSYNMKFQKGKFDFASLPKEAVSELEVTKRADIREALKTVREAKTAKERMMRARHIGRNVLLRGVLELVQANMLWSPATHAANILGNSGNMALKSFTRTMGLGLQALTHADMRYLQAAGAQYAGLFDGFVNAFKFADMTSVIRGEKSFREADVGHFWKALWTGEGSLDSIAKEDLGQSNSILVEAFQGTGWMKTLPELITLPFHALVGMDDAFKSMAYHSRLREEAFEAAMAQNPGKGAKDLWRIGQTLASDPAPELHYRALKFAREITYQEELGTTMRMASEAMNRHPVGIVFKIGFMPFFKTPVNIMRQAYKMTPLGLLSKEVRTALKAKGTVDQKDMIMRLVTGSAACYAFLQMYQAGGITGRRPEEAAEDWKNAKVQEYSRNFNGTWVPYDRFEPAGMVMGMMANVGLAMQYLDAYQTRDEQTDERLVKGEELFSAVVLALTDATLSKTYMTSMRESIELITGAERMNVEKFAARQSEKFLTASSAVNWWSERQDEYVREINEMCDGIIKYEDRTQLARARHGIYGTPAKLDPRWGGVFKTSVHTDDPVAWELLKIGANLRPMSRSINMNGVTRELTPQEFEEVNDILETLPLQQFLNDVIESDGYANNEDDYAKAQMLKGIISDLRSAAKALWQSENQEVTEELILKLKDRAGAIAGFYSNPDPVAQMYNWAKFQDQDKQPE